MTKYFTNFEDSDVGAVCPIGWTRRAAAALTPDLYTFSPENGSPAFKKRQIRAAVTSSSTRSAISYDTVGDIASSDMLLLVKVSGGSPTEKATSVLLYSRGIGGDAGAPLSQAYIAEFNFVAGTISLYRLSTASPDTDLLASGSFSFTEGESYFLRFRQWTGNQLQAKAWLVSGSEPSTWIAEKLSGLGITSNGWVGWGVYGSSGSRYAEISCVSVDSQASGSTDVQAQTPLTNALYTAWLASVSERCVLVEMQNVAYSASGVGDNENYLSIPASMGSPGVSPARTPDSVANSITGDLDLRIKFRIDSLTATVSGARGLISKYVTSTGSNLSYELILLDSGIPRAAITPTGVAGATILYLATEAIPGVSSAEDVVLRFTLDVDNGAGASVGTFYYSIDEGESWIPLGDPISAAVTSIFDGNTRLELGSRGDTFQWQGTGRIWWAQIRKGIDGPLVVDFDPTRTTAGASSFVASTGETWTIASPASITADVALFTNSSAYLSNMGFISKSWDSPASQPYRPFITKIPTFRREMSLALSEKATTNFGTLGLSNPRQTPGQGGVRDDWLRATWRRNYIKQYLGAPTWPKHDFRLVLLGRVQPPVEKTRGEITFEINDLTDAFEVPISDQTFSTGDYAGQVKPRLIGEVAMLEPPLTDSVDEVFQISDGAIEVDREMVFFSDPVTFRKDASGYTKIYDDGVELRGTTPDTLQVSSVDTGTETITTNVAHGFSENYSIMFPAGVTPPSPLVAATWYVVTNPGATTFQVTTEPGGAVINLTGAGAGTQPIHSRGGWFDTATGELTLANPPVGRITVSDIVGALSSINPNENLIQNLYDTIVFQSGTLSRNYKDTAAFTRLGAQISTDKYGLWLEPKKILVKDVLAQLSRGSFTWYGFSCDGLFQVGLLNEPRNNTPVMVLTESDVMENSLVLTDVLRPFGSYEVSYAKWFLTGGALNNAEQGPRQGQSFTFGNPVPLDPDPDETRSFETLIHHWNVSTEFTENLDDLFALSIGVFEFRTRLKATELSIGDTIRLTHSRYGWKLYSATDPPSPELTHPESYDMRLAVVIGIDTNLSANDPFPVKLKVYRQIPPYRFGQSLTRISTPGAVTNS